jgi:hypothetical protein
VRVGAPLGNKGQVSAYSPVAKTQLWSAEGARAFGWALALADDESGDGVAEIWVGGANAQAVGVVMLIDGATGKTLRTLSQGKPGDGFGLTLGSFSDVSGDGVDELLVGAPHTGAVGATDVGAAYLLDGKTGEILRQWKGKVAYARLGDVAVDAGDVDGDGVDDVAIGAPHTDAQSGPRGGEVYLYSGKSGAPLYHWVGRQPRENYGKSIASIGDLDGDGRPDLAIGAPWYGEGELNKAGRVEVRSGKSGAIIAEVFGDESMRWLGWSLGPSEHADAKGTRGLWIASSHSKQDAGVSAGALELYLFE